MHTLFLVRILLSNLLCFTSMVAGQTIAEVSKGDLPLFDGHSFEGWEGNLQWFRLERGAIVGGSLSQKIPRNEFLCTRRQFRNFELELKVKLEAGKGNAGIQIRSRRIPDHHEVIGYQADMGQVYWGALYDESRRREILAQPDPEELGRILKPDDWNDYRIRVAGDRIQLWLNGDATVDYVEKETGIEQKGIICLQIHSGPPSEAWYRDIVLTELPQKEE